ncbi:MAG: Clp protease ClpP, partial [Pseudomonadota bacterium]|nr:Clp protease ClpP [Pseudomonadota bacterium]
MSEILIYGIVGDSWDGLDAATLVPMISEGTDDLDVRINSPGGYVIEGLAIYNALIRAAANGRKVTCHIDGLAASMASVIAMAGVEVIMADNALMMIHNPWDCACGDAAELRRAADQLDRLRDQTVGIYAKRTGIGADELVAMLDAETWLTAEEALAQNFVTSISGAVTASASNVKAFGFRHVPDSPLITAKAMARTPRTAPAPEFKETIMNLYKTRAALVAAIATFQKDGGTQDEIDKIANSAAALDARDVLPATGALALRPVVTETAPVASAALTQADVQSAIAADRARASSIRSLGAKHKLPADFIEGLASGEVSLDVAREKMLDKLAEVGDGQNIGHTRIDFGADARDKWMAGAANWLMVRAGVANIVTAAATARGETVRIDPGEFRGVSVVDLARESLVNAGARLQSRDPRDIVGAALTARSEITQTTGDFSVLLENVMHKTLQAAYAVTPDTWSQFCGTGVVTDFRASNRYLRGTFGALDALNEAGEFKNRPIPDGAKEIIKASTKGNIINLSRQALINDDLGAFSDLAVDLGRAAKLTIEVDVYALLNSNPNTQDGNALFSAAHANLAVAGAPPTVAAFDAARVAMASQKDV